MTNKKFDPAVIHYMIIDSWPFYALYSLLSFAYVRYFPHLLGDSFGLSVLCGGVALTPLIFAAFIGWVIEERWNSWFDFLKKE